MNRFAGWCCVLAVACARPPSGGREDGAAIVAGQALARARACAGELEGLDRERAATVARALELEPARLAPVRGRPEELAEVRAAIEERLEEARATTGAARVLARLEVDDPAIPPGRADERARQSVRAADALCRAAAAARTDAAERIARDARGEP